MMNNDDFRKENESSPFSALENALENVNEPLPYENEEIPEEVTRSDGDNGSNPIDRIEDLKDDYEKGKELWNKYKNKKNGETPETNGEVPQTNPSNPSNLAHNQAPKGPKGPDKIAENAATETGKEIAKEGSKEIAKEGLKGGTEAALNAGGNAVATGTGGATVVGKAGTDVATTGTTVAATGTTVAATGTTVAATGTTVAAGTTVGTGATVAAESTNPVGWVLFGIEVSITALIIIGILIVCLILFIVFIVLFIILISENNTDLSPQDQVIVSNYCNSVTVTSGKYPGTYDYEVYIAGVVEAEVGMFSNNEVYKTFSIAARNYFNNRQKNCSIGGDDHSQAFVIPNNQNVKSAVAETKGLVYMVNGKIIQTEYDAFAVDHTDSNYYYLKQQGQQIPVTWVNNKTYLKTHLEDYKTANHGRGMSQWGALYLAETGKTYKEILSYYYGDGTLAKLADALFYSGEEIANTDGTDELHISLDSFLASKGTNVASLNNTIYQNVRSTGIGTRAGVVKAATTLIGTLKENYNIHLPYTYSGGHNNGIMGNTFKNGSTYGVDGLWGSKFASGYYYGDYGPYYYYGPDCSAFVAWAIYNGGYSNTMNSANNYKQLGSTCSAIDSSCNGQAGDLIHTTGHIVLIVGVSNSNYIVAEASGKVNGMRISTKSKKSGMTIVKMDNYYNNESNRRVGNYPQV